MAGRTKQDEPRAFATFSATCTGLYLMFGEVSGTFLWSIAGTLKHLQCYDHITSLIPGALYLFVLMVLADYYKSE